MITKTQALKVKEVHSDTGRYASRDGQPKCHVWRRNGRTKTFVRDVERFVLPVKFGLYAYQRITENTIGFHAPEDCPYIEDDVHVDWHMTPDEWTQLRGVLLENTEVPYIRELASAGKL